MTDEHERTHDDGCGDLVSRAVRAWRKNHTHANHEALVKLVRGPDPDDETPPELQRLIDVLPSGPDGDSEDVSRDIERERKDALRFLAENKPHDLHTPPDYPIDIPPREYIVRNWLPSNRMTIFVGAGGRGKSRLALQIASAVAGGATNWLANQNQMLPIEGGAAPVVFATYEDEKEEVWRRMGAIQTTLGKRPPKERFTLDYLAGREPLWGRPIGSRSFHDLPELTPTGRQLQKICEEKKARLLVIDPLAAAFGANENDRNEVRAFNNAWDSWATKQKCAVLVIAHPPKGKPGQEHAFSGSTDWLGGPRSLIWLKSKKKKGTGTGESPEQTALYLEHHMANYGPEGQIVWLTDEKLDGLPPVFGESAEADYRERGKRFKEPTNALSKHL